MKLLGSRPHLRLVPPPEEWPRPPLELPPLRDVVTRIARAAVITVVLIMACAYVLFGAQLALELQKSHDALTAWVVALLFAFVLAVGLKVMRILQRPPVEQHAAVVEHHHHHYNEGGD